MTTLNSKQVKNIELLDSMIDSAYCEKKEGVVIVQFSENDVMAMLSYYTNDKDDIKHSEGL